ncbi:MAG: glycosyltransferase [Ignavibacterium sp.]|nr:glycosyltransferase [Ignavibacterium sp.]
MTFSIIIPARNGESFISQTIDSSLSQTRTPDEVLLVDDASTDGTAKITQGYGNKIKYYHNQRATGFVDAWNRAINLASGDFVTILHQDDLLYPDYLMQIENAVVRFPGVRHVYTACNYIDENGAVIKPPPEPLSFEPVLYSGKEYAHNYLNGVIANKHIHRCPGVTTQRKLLLEECTYRKEAGHIADDDFFLRVGAFTDVVGISHPLASYRHHKDSETGKLDLLSLKLAEAYFFQAQNYKEGSSLLDSDDIVKVNEQAVRFINLLLFQGVLYKRNEWIKRAQELSRELDRIHPGFMEKTLPQWAKRLWTLIQNNGSSNLKASLYVKALNTMRKTRDFGRSFLQRK